MRFLVWLLGVLALLGFFGVLGLLKVSHGAEGGIACRPHEVMAEYLAARYGETPQAAALVSTGARLIVYVAEDGDWTMTAQVPDGLECVFIYGEAWHPMKLHETES